jgi:hypothetical protein
MAHLNIFQNNCSGQKITKKKNDPHNLKSLPTFFKSYVGFCNLLISLLPPVDDAAALPDLSPSPIATHARRSSLPAMRPLGTLPVRFPIIITQYYL